jgi:hypothetical protein
MKRILPQFAVRIRVCIAFLTALILLVGSGARGQTNAPPVSAADVQQAARVALVQGVAWLKQRAADDPDGWMIGPGRYRSIVGTTNIMTRWRIVTTQEPVFEYTNVVVFVKSSAGDPPRREVQRRPVRQIGTRPIERRVPDPNGPIEAPIARPVYEPGGTIYWHASTLGDAALATYALRCAGVPADDAVIRQMLTNIEDHLQSYGLPEHTWNLAWLTALFAVTPGEPARQRTEQLAGRLLEGQITDGPARGLWGPVCVSPRLLAVLMQKYLALMADIERAEAKLKRKPDSREAQTELDEAKAALSMHEESVRGFSRWALRLTNVCTPWSSGQHSYPRVLLAGSSHFFYNQTAADLETTATALHALSVAAAHRRLPAEAPRPAGQTPRPPPLPLPGRAGAPETPLPPPERAINVLARAANALAERQTSDGQWDEGNVHQPVTDFDTFTKILPVPVDPKSFPPLPARVTPASLAQGLAALDSIARTVGVATFTPRYGAAYQRGIAAQGKLDEWLAATWKRLGQRQPLTMADYQVYLAKARPLVSPEADAAAEARALAQTRLLVLASEADGHWGRLPDPRYIPTSTAARYQALKPLPDQVWTDRSMISTLSKAHVRALDAQPGLAREVSPNIRDGDGFATAVAVLYLAGHVADPAAALAEWADGPGLAELRQELYRVLRAAPSAPARPAARPAPAAQPPAEEPAEPAPDVPVLPPKPVETQPKHDEAF